MTNSGNNGASTIDRVARLVLENGVVFRGTAFGAIAVAHSAGEVVFPLSTFEPGEGVMVRVIAVPASGANLNRTFTLMALRAIQ